MVDLILGISNALHEPDLISHLNKKVSYCHARISRVSSDCLSFAFHFTLQFDSLLLLYPDTR